MTWLSASPLAVVGAVGAVIGSAGLGGLLTKWLDFRFVNRKQTDDVALTLLEQQTNRIDRLEQEAKEERKLSGSRLERVEEDLRVERQNGAANRLVYEANIALLRHRVNNLNSLLDGVLWMMEMAPDKAADFIAELKHRRSHLEATEATERAAIHQAIITAGLKPEGGASTGTWTTDTLP